MKNQSESTHVLLRYILARYPIISITTNEERRALDAVQSVARDAAYKYVAVWSITAGLRMYEARGGTWNPVYFEKIKRAASSSVPSDLQAQGIEEFAKNRRDPIIALDAIIEYNRVPQGKTPSDAQVVEMQEDRTLFVMLDLHRPLASKSPQLIRRLRDAANEMIVNCREDTIVLVSPELDIPRDLEKTVAVMDWPLPSEEEIGGLVQACAHEVQRAHVDLSNGSHERLVHALRGLTYFEASSALAAAIVETGELSTKAIPMIIKEKAQLIKKSGVLEFYETDASLSDIGGLEELRLYAAEVTEAFTDRARAAKLDTPKGVILGGVPGTGKSLYAKAFAAGKMPLLRMDVGAIMGSLVGQSEGNMRAALKVAEAVAPCVLWIDEVDKALSFGGGERDGGTSMRVFGTLLTWMQECTAPVYIIATANDVRVLKPEFIRRFDDIFWVDLPGAESRREIMRVHMGKRGFGGLLESASQSEIKQIDRATHGYTGAEIEKIVKQAVKTSFFGRRDFCVSDLVVAAGKVTPITQTMSEQVNVLRQWAVEHGARRASTPLESLDAAVDDAGAGTTSTRFSAL